MQTIDQQVALYMQGSEFGDDNIKKMMARELNKGLSSPRRKGDP